MTTTTKTDDFDVDRAIDRVRDTLSNMVGWDSHPEDLETAATGIIHDVFGGDDDEVLRAAGEAALRILADYVFALVEETPTRSA